MTTRFALFALATLALALPALAPTAAAHHVCPDRFPISFGPVDALFDRLYAYYTCDFIDLITTGRLLDDIVVDAKTQQRIALLP